MADEIFRQFKNNTNATASTSVNNLIPRRLPKITIDQEGKESKTDLVLDWVNKTLAYHSSVCYILALRPIDWSFDFLFILRHVNIKCDYCGNYPIHSAVLANDLLLVQTLMSSGANANFANDQGETALHLACSTRKTEIINYLLHCGANATILDNAGIQALHALDRTDVPAIQ